MTERSVGDLRRPALRGVVVALLLGSTAAARGAPDEERLTLARNALIERGDAHLAIELLDASLDDDPRDVEAWLLLGDAWWAIAAEWAAAGSNPFGPMSDSARAFERALQLAPLDLRALRGAHATRMELGDFTRALAVAEQELGQVWSSGGAELDGALERCARAVHARWRDIEPMLDGAELLDERAQTAARLRATSARRPGHAVLAELLGSFHGELGQPSVAIAVAAEGVRHDPDRVSLHQRLIDEHYALDTVHDLQALYSELRERAPGSAVVQWYCGYVELLLGDLARKEWRLDDGLIHYGRAHQALARAAELESAYAESVARIRYLAELGRLACLRQSGEFEAAGAEALELMGGDVLAEAPDLANLRDGLGRELADVVGNLCGDFQARRRFDVPVALARAMTRLFSSRAEWWNNLGFFRREYASQIEAGLHEVEGERASAARAVYEQSWQAYQRAVDLAPDDARIVNDAALIQVYHLRDDLPLAVEMLHRSIQLGDQQLAALGPDPDEAARFPLAQAVGDAYENLGYLDYHINGDLEGAARWFQASIDTDSGPRQNIHDFLDAIAGTRPPIEELTPSAAGFGAPEPERGTVAWERSFVGALARARQENRPLLVYYRGHALGLAVPMLDDWVRRAEFAEQVKETVCVLAAHGRTTHRDWRGDGSRLPSPIFGTVLCSDHERAAREFEAWWQENRDPEQPAIVPEGLHVLRPDGTRMPPSERSVFGALRAAPIRAGRSPSRCGPRDLDARTARRERTHPCRVGPRLDP